ncbi:MAG: hypothetical protein FJX67_15670 [Alphaproteobacteria bacterium]|nr:hypothetical protein [Alphaproteobacteria bacterium]
MTRTLSIRLAPAAPVAALMEDVVAIGAQQKALAQVGDRPTIDINFDNSAIQARRLLESRIAGEAATR